VFREAVFDCVSTGRTDAEAPFPVHWCGGPCDHKSFQCCFISVPSVFSVIEPSVRRTDRRKGLRIAGGIRSLGGMQQPVSLPPFLIRLGMFVRFSHTVFALPFALSAMLVAGGGHVPARVWGWILGCMVAARTAAMCFNRLVDWEIDKANPRTAGRHKLLTRAQGWGVLALCVVAVFFCTWHLNPLCFWLTPVMLFFIGFYSLTKRFTAYSHMFLGIALGIAPVGAWMAVRGVFWELPGFVLGLAVAAWTFGFDLIYSTLDAEFDRKAGLVSFPSRHGVARSLGLARWLHGAAAAGFACFGWVAGLGWRYGLACGLAALALIWEHRLVVEPDVERINRAFFQINAVVSILLFGGVVWEFVHLGA
jgi:4-hydroxybenzoate polyprenyltransferase